MTVEKEMTGRLRRAADYIDKNGWQQGFEHNYKTGAVDLIGALRRCEGPAGDFHFIRKILVERGYGESWNDKMERTPHDVVSYLRTATITEEELSGVLGPLWKNVRSVVRLVADIQPSEVKRLMSAWKGRPIGPWSYAQAEAAKEVGLTTKRWCYWWECGYLAEAALKQVPWDVVDESLRGTGEEPTEGWFDAVAAVSATASAVSVADVLREPTLRRLCEPWNKAFGSYPSGLYPREVQ